MTYVAVVHEVNARARIVPENPMTMGYYSKDFGHMMAPCLSYRDLRYPTGQHLRSTRFKLSGSAVQHPPSSIFPAASSYSQLLDGEQTRPLVTPANNSAQIQVPDVAIKRRQRVKIYC
ncbi:unnamed protein product [Pieris brassicae]|uniref:Uncharacterized protein n=1 Tax=Pieris brassicae TaxID=7116 RepID=A0A9P0TWI6_PIEBR|nr:unnamed protein product [Pieris brassicae]